MWVRLDEIFEINPKNTNSDSDICGFVPMANVDDGFSGTHSYKERKWGEVKKGYCHFQNGDIAVAKISPCFENLKSTIFHSLPNNIGAGTTELVILRGHLVYGPYFLYLFKSQWYIGKGIVYFKGVVGQQRVNRDIFTSLEVPLPPLNEQRRIVSMIQRLFVVIDIVENNSCELKYNIEPTKQRVLELGITGKLVPQDPADEPAADLLKRVNSNAVISTDTSHYALPTSWAWVKGKDLFLPMKSTTPKGNTFKYIDIDSIDNVNQRISAIKVLPSQQAPSRASRYTEKNNILFSMVRPYLRNIAIVTEDDCIASTGFYVCRQRECLDYKYLYYLMTSNYVVDGLNSFMKGDNSPSINKGNVDEYVFPLPPLNEQKRIVSKVDELFAVIDQIKQSLE